MARKRQLANGIVDRRKFITAAGASSAAFFAGCTGGGNESTPQPQGDGDGDGASTPMSTPTPEPESMQVTAADIGPFELTSLPHTVACNEVLPEMTDDRFRVNVSGFNNTTTAHQALLTHSIAYVGSTGIPKTFQAIAAGNTNLRFIYTKMKGTDYVLVKNDDMVDDYEQFLESDDMAIGISSKGGMTHIQTAMFYLQEGYDPTNLTYERIGGSSSRTSAVATGKSPMVPIHLAQYERIKQEGAPVSIVVEFREIFPEIVFRTIPTTDDNTHLGDPTFQEMTQNYLNAVTQVQKRFNEDFEFAHQKVEQYQMQPLPEDSLRDVWEFHVDQGTWVTEGFNTQGYVDLLETMTTVGLIEEGAIEDPEQYIVTEYAENAYSEYGTG